MPSTYPMQERNIGKSYIFLSNDFEEIGLARDCRIWLEGLALSNKLPIHESLFTPTDKMAGSIPVLNKRHSVGELQNDA